MGKPLSHAERVADDRALREFGKAPRKANVARALSKARRQRRRARRVAEKKIARQLVIQG